MIIVTNNEGGSGIPTTAKLLEQGVASLDAIEAGVPHDAADEAGRTRGRGGWPTPRGVVLPNNAQGRLASALAGHCQTTNAKCSFVIDDR